MRYTRARYGTTWMLICLLAGCLSMVGCESAEPKNVDVKGKYVIPDSLVKLLQIDTVSTSKVVNAITLSGKVDFNADNVVRIYPPLSGIVQNATAMLGDYVKAGQALAVIKSSEMAGYSNDLTTAQSNVQVAQKNMDATNDMYKSGLASQKDLVTAEAGLNQAKSALEKAQRVLQLNGGNQNGEYIAKSPISGFIVEKFVTNNMVLRADNSTSLFTISDLKVVWIIANVYESNIPFIKMGDSVTVSTLSYPGRVFKGKVDKIMNVLDPTNKVMKVRIVLANPDYLLKPEMFANVTVNNTENKQMLSVPSAALIFDHSQYYVLVYKSPSDVSIRPVNVVNTVGDKSYISDGLIQGEKVIASPVAILIYQELNS